MGKSYPGREEDRPSLLPGGPLPSLLPGGPTLLPDGRRGRCRLTEEQTKVSNALLSEQKLANVVAARSDQQLETFLETLTELKNINQKLLDHFVTEEVLGPDGRGQDPEE